MPPDIGPGARQARATIFTTRGGIIEVVDTAAARLLNLSERYCEGRDLFTAFACDRPAAMAAMREAIAGHVTRGDAVIRPRERKPRPVSFEVAVDAENDASLKWTFEARGEAARPAG